MTHTGLTTKEAQATLLKHGPNLISEPEKLNPLLLLWQQFKSPLIYVLIGAALVSALLHEITEAIFILFVVVVNTALGFFQEYRAENIFLKLKQKISKHVAVIRDGQKSIIDVDLLVPGDLIEIRAGLRIPADGYLIEATELSINESILTGESIPFLKKATSKVYDESLSAEHLIFMGTSVFEGYGKAIITQTGNKTRFGQIAASLESKFDPPTPIKSELIRISKIIAVGIIIVVGVILALGLVIGLEFQEIFLTSVALGVSTIPEGLLISLTVTLAYGMNKIMAKKSLVRNLPTAETLGAIETLCIDKTGTLTEGKMQVTSVDFTDSKRAVLALAMCNNDNNFIDKALQEFIKKNSETALETIQTKRQVLFPFSSEKKYTGALDKEHLYIAGAPEKVLELCKSPSTEWHKKILAEAQKGNRLVGVAFKEIAKDARNVTRSEFTDLEFLGLVLIKDPVRSSVTMSLEKIKKAGIDIKVITGDLKETSLAVLSALNFHLDSKQVLSGDELSGIKGQRDFDKAVKSTVLFYRTTPDQKFKIVQSLQRQKIRVGMMGDGVNDSPAIKAAEVGITVEEGTDVTKEVADLILLDSNFQTIVDAIEEGRNIFQNLRKIMVYLFADSLSETTLILFCLIIGLPLPLLPLQLLWINIMEDGLPSLALSFDRSNRDLLAIPPRKKNTTVFDKSVIISIVAISLIVDLIYVVLFKFMIDNSYQLNAARTIVFAGVSLSSLLFLFSAKTVDTNIWKENIFNNRFLNISLLISLVILITAIYLRPFQELLGTVALNEAELALVVVLAFVHLVLTELIKIVARKVQN